MTKPENAMAVFRHLEKSNCGLCGEKTCLAFAGAVYQGRRALEDCPRLDPEAIRAIEGGSPGPSRPEDLRDDFVRELLSAVARCDLAAAADRVGGRYSGGRLTIKILGKDFGVDAQGRIFADIHVNPWVAVPFLQYVLHARGTEPTGQWVSFRELKEGRERYPLFRKRCEGAMKRVADRYPDLFDDMVHLFGERQVPAAFASDVSVVLLPLPRVPVMICYWRPDGGLASGLNVYFDAAADENLDIGSIFSLTAGLAQMFDKVALRHGAGSDGTPRVRR